MPNNNARQELHARQQSAARTERRRSKIVRSIGWLSGVAVAAIVAGMLTTSQSVSAASSSVAPDFTLPTTSNATVSLAKLRGKPVLLYFNEGAGCGSCILQMGEIEKRKADFDALGLTVLPIVMNSRADITADMQRYGVTTPFLLDDGTASKAYGTLGKGMHAGLPGHSFVLIDAAGIQRWYGEYPSMWLSPDDLLAQVRSRLGS